MPQAVGVPGMERLHVTGSNRWDGLLATNGRRPAAGDGDLAIAGRFRKTGRWTPSRNVAAAAYRDRRGGQPFRSVCTVEMAVRGLLAWLALSVTAAARPAAAQTAGPAGASEDPQLESVLRKWQQATDGIDSLEGVQDRIVYDKVFFTAKHTRGHFYYQAPDKGRIDFDAPKDAKPNARVTKTDPKTGKVYEFQVTSGQPETWICDGKFIVQIDHTQKTANKYPLPPDVQGKNIINGPLPFLFGLPPEVAKQRYRLKLLGQNEHGLWIHVVPKWKQDAANYREATVILDPKTFLPRAVQLIDPAGTKETVFMFDQLKVNQAGHGNIVQRIIRAGLLRGDPFDPPLRGYKVVVHEQAVKVPNVLRMNWKTAQATLAQRGFKVRFERGAAAPDAKLTYTVARQVPAPDTLLAPGETVELTLFLPPQSRKDAR
ncbi:MAG: PASTA domain-containing protein [Planctomycetota bacterium]|nr:MAG: PASTA domain-containing protein [Planctomycetota bacterium]